MSIERRMSAALCRSVNEQTFTDATVSPRAMALSDGFIHKFRGHGVSGVGYRPPASSVQFAASYRLQTRVVRLYCAKAMELARVVRLFSPREGTTVRKYRLPMLNLLLAFEAAARHQSMKKAAHELNLSRIAVSRQIRKLEESIGRNLFERLPNKLVLTDEGRTLLSAVNVALFHVQRAVTELSGQPHPERLVLSVDPDFAGMWLVPRLAEFYEYVPDTVVEIIAEKRTLSLRRQRVHGAIRYGAAGSDVENREILFRSRLFPVYSPALARARPLRSLIDLGRHVLLHDRSMREWAEYLSNGGAGGAVDASKGFVFSKSALCLEAAVRGLGVAMGDDFLAATYLAEGRLIRPFEPSLISRNAYYFWVPPGASKHPAVGAFRSWLLHSVGRHLLEAAAVG
jgi:LysR family glycine cleavage system transcriptional activator